jgi:hypothetical protein
VRPTVRLRATWLQATAFAIAFAAGAAVGVTVSRHTDVGWSLDPDVWLTALCFGLGAAFGSWWRSLEMADGFLRVHTPFGRSIAWNDVQSVEVTASRWGSRRVVLTTRSWGRVRLPVLFSGRISRDPRFDEKVALIRDRVRAAHGVQPSAS